LLVGAGVPGIGFTVTTVVPKVLAHPATIAVTEYVPLAATVAPMIDGFCVPELNAFGPDHEYVAPTILVAVKFNVDPAQIGVLLDAVGADGVWFTTTFVVPAELVHPFTVTVSEYVPAIANVAPGRVGFCNAELNAEGPVHEYVAPTTGVVVNVIVLPVQTGELLPGAGATGIGFTVTTVVPAVLVQPATLAVTVYVPLAATVAPTMEGFCVEDENALGPVHEYVAPTIFEAVKFNVEPAQIGVLLEATGAVGVWFTTTFTVPAELVHPPTVTVTLYVPDIPTTAPGRVGFCNVEVNADGPVHE